MSAPAARDYLWTGLGLVAPLGARVSGFIPRGITGISIDSRSLQKGELFFAIRGLNSDGHDYVGAAFEKGASAAVVDEAHIETLPPPGPYFVVADVLTALEQLGIASRGRTKARVVAVTGSVGKTSTKEALRLVLSKAGAAHASAASYNNHWGVPLSLARMPRETEFGIFEIGMNHKGEILPLTAMVRPHVAIITTIAPVHLEYFANVDEIAVAKAEIFSGLIEGGLIILNRDLPQYELLLHEAHSSPASYIASFGEDVHSDARLLNVRVGADGCEVEAEISGQRLAYRLGMPGRHFAMNSLAVLLAAKAFGTDLDAAAQALAQLAPQPGRGERVRLSAADGPYTLIDESYNANPASMCASFEVLGGFDPPGKGRRIAILGDMLELGEGGSALHEALAHDIEANHVDLVFAAGPLMKHLFDALPEVRRGAWAIKATELEPVIERALHRDDIALVKGSNASGMGGIVKTLKSRAAQDRGVAPC